MPKCSVERSPNGFLFRVDEYEAQRIAEGMAPQTQYWFVRLLTVDREVGRLDRTQLPNGMDVDWVWVWQSDAPDPRTDTTSKKN